MIITALRSKVGAATKATANVIGANVFVPGERSLSGFYRQERLTPGVTR
jgi:hypothetical protein